MSAAVGNTAASGVGGVSRRALEVGAALAVVIILLLVPLFLDPRGINFAIKMLIAALFAMGFNVLWSQARLLSFGQAAPFGVGAFAVLHFMRWIEATGTEVPTPLVPFAGVIGGLAVGIVAGYFATARSGTYFSMITLAMGELLYNLARRWDSIFGGETGMSGMRMPWGDLTFGSFDQVYYVVLAWVLIGIGLMWYLTLTPFGRIAAAVGNNEERLRFLGYNTRALKTKTMVVSCAAAGLAGGLMTFTTENASYEMFSGPTSGAAVIQSFIGGVGVFLGPAVGAICLTLFGLILSDVTRIWLLYQGIIFILVIILLPAGLTGSIMTLCTRRAWASNLRGPLFLIMSGVTIFAVGTVLFSEIAHRFFQHSSGPATIAIFRTPIPVDHFLSWIVSASIALAGLAMLLAGAAAYRRIWALNKASTT